MVGYIKITANGQEVKDAQRKQSEHSQAIFAEQDPIKKRKLEKVQVLIPEVQYNDTELLFDVEDVKFAFINHEGAIALSIDGEKFVINYTEDTWKQLQAHFAKTKFKGSLL